MQKILLSEEQIQEIVKRVAGEINDAIRNEKKIPLIVGVMKGSMNFMLDLIKYIDRPIYTDYIQISSYAGTRRTKNTRLLKDVSFDCTGRTVIIVEDIIDTGYSMKFLIEHFYSHSPKQVLVCALMNKKNAREVPVQLDFCGFTMEENKFIVGYGLDYNEICRNINYIYEVDREEIEKLNNILKQDEEY